ncbi:MAG TPA: hypothetical protein VF627_06180 [Abditibacterium sp.]|jgi:hypothetical protein
MPVPTPVPNGYDRLIAAAQQILPGENGSPSAAEILAPDENLRRQRLAVARNAPALSAMRAALLLPIQTPPGVDFTQNGRLRELARQLIQESEVRAADGDFVGALNSRLDCLELGAAVSRGPLISMLVGSAIESVGRDKIEVLALKLDAPQSRAAASRLAQIEARRPTFSDIVRLEGEETLRLNLQALPDEARRAALGTPEGRKEQRISERQARELLALTPEIVRANNTRLFSTAIAAARVPLRLARMVPLPENLDSSTAWSRPLLQDQRARSIYERNIAQNRLLQAAMELRAQKLETGAYPETFVAPRDPFSNEGRLIYRRTGDTYLLYSIGPDARDNGGRAASMQRVQFDVDSGQTRTIPTRNLGTDFKGDLVAPVL